MTSTYLNPYGLPERLLPYATGEINEPPTKAGLTRQQVRKLHTQRQAYVRNLLFRDRRLAYALPDFDQMLHDEIKQHATKVLQPLFFLEWDKNLREAHWFAELFFRTHNEIMRDYKSATESGRPFMKLRYVAAAAKRKTFAMAIQDPRLLGELELVCLGELRYGLPPRPVTL